MAKIYGLFGSMTGKLADTVMAVRNGEQIVRKYQPNVSNPSTVAQVAVRARMKLMSQLSALLAPIIAFRNAGIVSARNLFTKHNFMKSSYDNATAKASVAMNSLDLTGSSVGIPGITITRNAGQVSAALESGIEGWDAVVYGFLAVKADGDLQMAGVQRVTVPGAENTYPSDITVMTSSVTGHAYAYAIRFDSERARAAFMNAVAEGEDAVLSVMRSVDGQNATISESVYAEIPRYQA